VLAGGLGVAATVYFASTGKAEEEVAAAHVRAAVAGAEAWYQDPLEGDGSYRGLTVSGLLREASSVSTNVRVTILAGGAAYCLSDVEARGHSAYYVGGAVDRLTLPGGAALLAPTIVRGTGPDAAAVCSSMA